MAFIKPELMEILACPADQGDLKELDNEQKLECLKCGRRYQYKDGILVMLLDEAEAPTKKLESE
jgi:uncharacterized protein YbaR (Trm112 family)